MKAKTLFGLFLFLEKCQNLFSKTVFRLNKFKFMTFLKYSLFSINRHISTVVCRLSLSKLEA